MARRKKRKSKKRAWLLFSFVGAAAAIFFFLNIRIRDKSNESLQIEQNVNALLLKANVPEKNVFTWIEEMNEKNVSWLKINKKIVIPKEKWQLFNAGALLKNLDEASAYSIVSKRRMDVNSLKIDILKNNFIYCSLTLSGVDKKPRLCIVIDDCGASKKKLTRFTELGIPITYTILPYQRHTTLIARSLAASGFDTLLHLPMEPRSPDMKALGKGALLIKMSRRKIKKKILAQLKKVPGVKGVNNHMGSLFTENTEKMEAVLKILKAKKLFFLDSATSPNSVCKVVASKVGVKCLRNNIFLDNIDSPKEIKKRLRQAIAQAVKNDYAIAIGHVTRKHTAGAIEDMRDELEKVELVPLSELMENAK